MSEPRRLILLRHGRTAWNAEDRAQGHADIGLDDVGRRQAETVAPAVAALSPARLWSSDLARARETAGVVSVATGLPVATERRLREFAIGDNRAGLTFAEYAERHPVEAGHLVAGRPELIPGRETTDQLLARFLPALQECADAVGEGETGVLVSHGAALRVALVAFLGWPASAELTLGAMANCGWAELEFSTSGWTGQEPTWRLRAYNRVA